MWVSKDFVFIHVPKTGGNFVRAVLSEKSLHLPRIRPSRPVSGKWRVSLHRSLAKSLYRRKGKASLILIPCCAGVPEPGGGARASLRYRDHAPEGCSAWLPVCTASRAQVSSPRQGAPLVRCESVGDFSDAAPQRTAQRCFVLGKRQCTVLACDVARAVRRAAAARGDEL